MTPRTKRVRLTKRTPRPKRVHVTKRTRLTKRTHLTKNMGQSMETTKTARRRTRRKRNTRRGRNQATHPHLLPDLHHLHHPPAVMRSDASWDRTVRYECAVVPTFPSVLSLVSHKHAGLV